MSVFRNLDCLSLVVCSNTTLLKLQIIIYFKFCASKSGVRLIHGCGFYMNINGNYTENGSLNWSALYSRDIFH